MNTGPYPPIDAGGPFDLTRPGDPLVLAELVLQFGRVKRATRHPDGVTPETDTDHTVMLAVIACELATAWPDLYLDTGKLAELAIVHDLVEAYAGDTDTAGGLGPEAKAAKADRERAALRRIKAIGTRWLADAIETYERQDTEEARFLRYLDKVLPKLTHRLNACAVPRERGRTLEAMRLDHARQGAELRAMYPEFSDALGPLFDAAAAECERALIAD